MEHVRVGNDAGRFDAVVHGGPPEAGDLEIAYKPNATAAGLGGVCVTFTAEINGKPTRVQATTTAANFLMAAAAVKGWENTLAE